MLHSHGDDDYGPVVHCSYQTTSYPDALANYTPYNPVHKRGNFHYDITQWNNPDDPLSDHRKIHHIDWVGFSSIVEPNVYECNYYSCDGSGSHGCSKPPAGTHIDIEQRILDRNSYSYGETAGAMGWFLPNLSPNQTTSITVAFMFGTENWPNPTILIKDDNVPGNNCVLPGSPITYTLHYDANGLSDTNVSVIDELQDEVDYNWSSSGSNFDPNTRKVIWNFGTVSGGYSGDFTLIVNANELAEPCGVLINRCEVVGDFTYKYAEVNTTVCHWCPQPGIIYVDDNAFYVILA
jgi:hypothetical protein